MLLFIVAAIVIALAAIVFALQNPSPVTINFLTWQFQDSLALVLLITLAIGVLIGLLVCIPSLIRRNLKISKQQRRYEQLQEETQYKERDLSKQGQFADLLRQQMQDRLDAFGLIEPTTGFLTQKTLSQVCQYLLQRMRSQPDNSRYQSISVLLIRLTQVTSDDGHSQLSVTDPVLRAIAQAIEDKAYAESWLHSDGQHQFACVTPGLEAEAAADYGEMLRATLNELSIPLKNGAKVQVSASIGGALADTTHPVDRASELIQHAEEALDKSQERGSDRFAWFRLGLDKLMWN
jgi:diguanylate cyclase (GGDEF)-like protein